MASHLGKHGVHPPPTNAPYTSAPHVPVGQAGSSEPGSPGSHPLPHPPTPTLGSDHHTGPYNPIQPAPVQVQPPQFQPQPWVYDLLGFLRRTTRGMVRVDLRRPTLPMPDTLGDNIFVTRRRRGRGQQQRSQFQRDSYPTPYNKFPNEHDYIPGYHQDESDPVHPRRSGARLKITRHVSLFTPADGGRPLLDLSLGLNFDMDTQRLRPVARFKVKDWLAIKAVPLGVLRAGRSFRIGEKLALKAAYELPLEAIAHPLAPPARFMIRLDNFAGAGLHLSPTGIEFDQRVIALGSNVTVRASGSLLFPRQLPIDPERDGAFFSWKIHRLGLKTAW